MCNIGIGAHKYILGTYIIHVAVAGLINIIIIIIIIFVRFTILTTKFTNK
jgi:hypothetical protein